MNEVLNTIVNRKSVRAYTGKPISDEDRKLILRAAMEAPTAGNQQLYTILDITDKEIRKNLSILCDNQPFINDANLCLVFLADCRRWKKAYELAGCEARKPMTGDIILSFADACIAAQNTVIAAESLGIGSCYIGDVLENCDEMRKLLNIPKDMMPAVMLVFGYPTDQQMERQKPARFRNEAIIMENVFKDRTDEDLREDFTERAERQGLAEYNFENNIIAFCKRKYTSDFSMEMSRSCQEYLNEFLPNQ